MTVLRLDNVAIVVDDLDVAVAFFTDLGLTASERMEIEGPFADQTVGLPGVRSTIVWMTGPEGSPALELTQYSSPEPVRPDQAPAANTIGLHRLMFAVDDIDATVARLATHGAAPLDRIADYEGVYRLCYLRGPSGIIVALAERTG